MTPNRKPARSAISAKLIAISTAYAVVMATGLLTISLSFVAWVNDTSFVDYYQYVFPRFRGGSADARVPMFGYAAFVVYISVAVLVGIRMRKRIEGAGAARSRSLTP